MKYKLDEPSLTESVSNDMLALPSNDVPLIVLAVASVVAVSALPVTFPVRLPVTLPVILPVKVLDAVMLTPVVIQALFAAFLTFNTLLAVSTHN